MGYPVRVRQCFAMTLVLLALALAGTPQAASAGQDDSKMAFMVSDYRYEPAEGATVNPDIGLALCGTRCNALSGDFASYIKPGGWKMVKIAAKVEKRVELNNPFLAGKCLCVGDEYKITWYDPGTYMGRPDAQRAAGE